MIAIATSSWAGGLGPKKASSLVTVQTGSTACTGGFSGARKLDVQLNADGTTGAFSVAEGGVFVITNVEFDLSDSGASTSVQVRLGKPCGAGCMQPILNARVLTDSSGGGGTTLALTNGIAVKPGVDLCIADVNYSSPNTFVALHGYFAKDK